MKDSMVTEGKTNTGASGRGPFYVMLALIACMLVIAGVSVACHLNENRQAAEHPDAGQQTAAEQQPASDEQASAPASAQAREVARVKKAKSRKQLVKLAGAGKKGRKLSVIGSSYSAKSASARKVSAAVAKLEKRHKVAFVMLDVKTGQGLSYDPTAKFYCASAIKGPYVIALNKWKRAQVKGSVRTLMREAIEVSDNKAYESLHSAFGAGVTRKMMRYSGATSFDPEYSYGYGSARDFARFWVTGYWYFFNDQNKNSKWCRGLFDSVNESFIHQAMKGESTTYSKAGWFPGDEFDNVHNDAGIVMAKVDGKSRPYVLAVMSTAYGSEKQLRKLVRALDDAHEDMMYQ